MSVELMRPATTAPTDSGRAPQSKGTDAADGGVRFGVVLAGQKAADSAPEKSGKTVIDDARETPASKTADVVVDTHDPAQAIERQRHLASAHRDSADKTAARPAHALETAPNGKAIEERELTGDGPSDKTDSSDSVATMPALVAARPAQGDDVSPALSPHEKPSSAQPQAASLATAAGEAQAPIDARNASLVPVVETGRTAQATRTDTPTQSRTRSDTRLVATTRQPQTTEAMTLDTLQAEAGANDNARLLTPTVDRLFAGNGERFKLGDGRAAATSNIDFTGMNGGPAGSTHANPAPAAMASPALPTPAMAAAVNAPLGSEAWKQAINQQALRLSHFGDGSAELTLYPRELGQLHVSLKMGEQAQLHFVSAHADVRAAVETALPQLRHAFADNGINLGQASVSDQGHNAGQSSNPDSSSRGSGRGMGAGITGDAITGDIAAAPVATTTLAGRTLDGGIDIFA